MKKIAINALTIDSHPSGGKTYLVNLVENMSMLAGESYIFYLLIIGCYSDIFTKFLEHNNIRLIKFPRFVKHPIIRVLVEQLYLPIWLWTQKIDMLFAARNVMPLLTKCPTVVGILSMHLNYAKEDLPRWRRIYGSSILKITGKRAEAYVAISSFAGETYLNMYGLPKNRLFIAPLGFDEMELKLSDLDHPLSIESPYILFVSTLFPHKNVAFLIRVFRRVIDSRPDLKLVIVGRDVDGAISLLTTLADSLGIKDKVNFTGGISDNELAHLYTNARVFVFPSLTEGFGLSVLEAMAFGVPVVASNRTSIPEVVGNAGIILDPVKEDEWARAILTIVDDEAEYSRYSQRSRERARLFSWKKTAEITLDCFNQVLGSQ
jgi:glycosyltransferase involved in cell wall biosynthesis